MRKTFAYHLIIQILHGSQSLLKYTKCTDNVTVYYHIILWKEQMFFSIKYHVNTSIVNPKAIPVNLTWIIQNLTGLTNPTEKHMKVAIASMLNKKPDFSNLAVPLYNSWVF